MTTEAEKLANELVGGYPEPTWHESAAAALIRQQAEQIDAMKLTINNMSGILDDQSDALIHKDAEIDRLRAEANTCGSGAGCCAQAAEIERLNFIIGALEGSLTSLEDKDKEIERLRAAQAHAVMPLIGPLLDAWECCSQDVRSEHPELDKQLRRINRAMEDAGA